MLTDGSHRVSAQSCFNMSLLIHSSQIQYADDFLERQMAAVDDEMEENLRKGGKRTKLNFRHATHEVKPKSGNYSGEMFKVLIGSDSWPTTILEPDDVVPHGGRTRMVPVEYRSQFETDPDGACREYLGVATAAIAPFLAQKNKVAEAFKYGEEDELKPWVGRSHVDLGRGDELPTFIVENMPTVESGLRKRPHFIHIDLSQTGDATGVAMSRLDGWMEIKGAGGIIERLPVISVPLVVGIKPSSLKPIDQGALSAWITRLSSEFGFRIEHIGMDSYQGVGMLQGFRKSGFVALDISVDKTMQPDKTLRTALYQGRISIVPEADLNTEFSQLKTRRLPTRFKVDHPPRGKKDLADAVAGAVYGASMSPETRSLAFLTDPTGKRIRVQGERP